MRDKRVQFDNETWKALADLLRKHGRPVDLKTALRQSVGEIEKRPLAPPVRRRDASRKAHKGD